MAQSSSCDKTILKAGDADIAMTYAGKLNLDHQKGRDLESFSFNLIYI